MRTLEVDDTELEFVCSVTDSNSTADDLPGPGRALDRLYTYVGIRLEVFLGKVAVAVGKGPLVTARRIRRNREIMICMTRHGRRCHCEAQLPMSSGVVKRTHKKIDKDCKRLVRYVEYVSTSYMVVQHADLSFCHEGPKRTPLGGKRLSRSLTCRSGMASFVLS